MSYNHQRPLSPGGRRIQNQGRLSDNTLTDPYSHQRHNSYASPRSSGVIPISTQTFVNVPPPISTPTTTSASREPRYDSYTGRQRRSSLVDNNRATTGSVNQLPSRSRPTIVQQDIGRPSSPSKHIPVSREYYITPASSQEPRASTGTHKKLYSVDDGGAKLVADVNIPVRAGGERLHKRRDSTERGGYRTTAAERDRGSRGYHVNSTRDRPKDKSIDDDDAYSYTDPAGMYRDTEPTWREVRPRRGSMDRGGATSRERPASVLDPTLGLRPAAKEVGPPPSTRGWDKITDIGRTRSVRDTPRASAQSPTRGRMNQEPEPYGDPRDQYYDPPRTSSTERRSTVNSYDSYDYDRESRRPERRRSIARDARADRSVERRGFGIRVDPRNDSQTRYGGRDWGSDESFEHQTYRDSGYAEPHRRETATGISQHDLTRLEQEKRGRELAQRMQNDEYSRPRERAYSAARDNAYDHPREPRRRDDDRAFDRDYDRPSDRDYERDGERDRERIRSVDPLAERERERHHHRQDTDRDREYSRKESSPRQSSEAVTKPGPAQVVTGGLAGAATAFGLSNLLNKISDKRDKNKDEYQDRDSERERDRDRDRTERVERRNGDDREYPRERRQAPSDEPASERDSGRDRYPDTDRGLGFAFEAPPEPPKSAPPTEADRKTERKPEWTQTHAQDRSQDSQTQDRYEDRVGSRDVDRDRQNDTKSRDSRSNVEMPAPAVDPDEDYRRRMEQVQRELGRTTDDQRGSDSDADRERRRREREQRQRERESRTGSSLDTSFSEAPPHASLRNFDRDSSPSYASTSATTSTPGADLKRKSSILDRPMTNEPAQIIDNSLSVKQENRVRIVDPPTEEEEKRPKGILKRPTEKFPEDRSSVREGVAPLKDATKKGIPPGARWTKIDRRLVNPEALEAAQERFEERLDCVIVLRVLTKEEIQKLADRTRDIRDRRYEEDRSERKSSKRADRNRDRRDRDEVQYSDSEDEFKPKTPKMLEAPSTAGSSNADFVRDNRDRRSEREREAEPSYMSGGLGRRDEQQTRY